jgi:hypothetical protein
MELSSARKLYRRVRRKIFVIGGLARSRFGEHLFGKKTPETEPAPTCPSQDAGRGLESPVPPSLNLAAGDRVRVKSHEEIMATLNAEGRFQGLSYTPAMKKHCGGTYAVFKRVDLVFDERRWKLSKIRNVVLLEGVYCDGAGGPGKEWDGCDRSCFIWWKEGWLERAPQR